MDFVNLSKTLPLVVKKNVGFLLWDSTFYYLGYTSLTDITVGYFSSPALPKNSSGLFHQIQGRSSVNSTRVEGQSLRARGPADTRQSEMVMRIKSSWNGEIAAGFADDLILRCCLPW